MVIIERSVSCGVPVAVFFLTVDRSLTLGLRMEYGRRHQLSVVAATFVSAGCLIGGSAYLYAKHLSPVESRSGDSVEDCWKTFCFFEYPDDYQFLVRIVFGAANVVASLVFFALLRSQNSRNKAFTNANAKRRGNTFIKYALASELALNSIPHLACVLYQLIAKTDISWEFGTYSRVLIAIDAVMCATAYRRTKAVTTVTVSPLSGSAAFTKTARR
ncbi:hypothetical protein AAVH_36477 [Aphelenchoides avenae]|nr:hypothetical protein AAVH_36477 [Aphelenchus avenae]